MNKVLLKDFCKKWWLNNCNLEFLSEFLNKLEVMLLMFVCLLNIIDLFIVFILFLFGIIVGVIMLLVEVYFVRKKVKVS